jgi:hypothetical protein
MRRLEVKPEGWPCKLSECPPGLFLFGDGLCFKTEYRTSGYSEVFCESGEMFWGGTDDKEQREVLTVQPVIVVWEDY